MVYDSSTVPRMPDIEPILRFFVLFCSIHLFVSYLAAPLAISKRTLDSLSLDNRISVSEKICSSVNSILTGCIGVWIIFLQPQFVGKDLFHVWPLLLDLAFSMYLGYTLYDLLTMVFQKHHWTMWLHHATGALGAIIMLVYKKGAIYPCYFMITEFTAIINNMLWYVKTIRDADVARNERMKAGGGSAKSDLKPPPPPSLLYVNLMYIRAWAFVFLRVWVGPYALWVSVVGLGGWEPLLKEWMVLPLPALVIGSISFAMFTLLNFIWTPAVFAKATKAAQAYKAGKAKKNK
ncbi:hypothetical protein BASA50_003069 [Batrachochytrium salamandrivorans]|uniref:TLC domain-containing protein n=1 Tax=Batrachochytrium salamandrivorans TaxID=1357716 RepID=A0ABQ8FML5_9FUNG|nr:hypothetical protein BASA50_003069 [Batrachochytrium salamandrivorans]KAH9268396.1 hypothetical protein BASA83_009395 [Batrachochytrium salamandrivorans]KAJ1328584.1 hypothetical protein BSLG_010316 [Batrachochytrium salamandrivorans]